MLRANNAFLSTSCAQRLAAAAEAALETESWQQAVGQLQHGARHWHVARGVALFSRALGRRACACVCVRVRARSRGSGGGDNALRGRAGQRGGGGGGCALRRRAGARHGRCRGTGGAAVPAHPLARPAGGRAGSVTLGQTPAAAPQHVRACAECTRAAHVSPLLAQSCSVAAGGARAVGRGAGGGAVARDGRAGACVGARADASPGAPHPACLPACPVLTL